MRDVSIIKVGGTSLMEQEHVGRVGKIMSDDPRRQYAVVSAPGDKQKENRVTQRLKALCAYRGKEDDETQKPLVNEMMDFLVEKYEKIYPGKGGSAGDLIRERYRESTLPEPAYIAALTAVGEKLQGQLLAEALGFEFIDSAQLFVLTNDYGHARVLPETYARLGSFQSRSGKYILSGFYGATAEGQIATFSYGGSNQSVSVAARGLDVSFLDNFSDNSIRAAHPDIVSNAKVILEMTFKELRDLSYSGFSIFHPEATAPLVGTGITLQVRRTEDYPDLGTRVIEDRVSDPARPIVGIAYKPDFCAFTVEKMGLNDIMGVIYDLLGVFHKAKIPIEFPATGIDDISIIVEQKHVRTKIYALKKELSLAAGENGTTVTFTDNLGCLAVAGKELYRNRRISADIGVILADHAIDTIAESKGVGKRCFMYAVDMQQGHLAVNVLYNAFIR